MKVIKFGSSTATSPQRLLEITNLVSQYNDSANIIVFSAIDGTTESLEEIADYLYKKNADGAKELTNNLERQYINWANKLYQNQERCESVKSYITEMFNFIREMSKNIFTLFEEKRIIACGVTLSTHLMYECLLEKGLNVKKLSAIEFMRTDKNEEPDVNHIKENLAKQLDDLGNADIFITEGSICKNAYNEIDYLGIGGNDYTASLIGAAIHADEIIFWSDSDGIYNNNPRIVKNAQPVKELNFDEAAEISYFLTRIIHPTCIMPAKLANIPVRLMSIGNPQSEGTLISNDFTQNKIKAIASKDGITSIRIKSGRMLMAHGFLRKVFEIFENHKTAIDMVTTSEIGVSITIDNDRHIEEIMDSLKRFGTVSCQKGMTIVCIIGDLSCQNIGMQSQIIESLKEIPTHMISYGGSPFNSSFLINTRDKEVALNSLNNQLF